MKKYLLIAASFVAFAPAAHAADAVPSANAFFYAGVEGGLDRTNVDTTAGSDDITGGDYGLFAGYKMNDVMQNGMGLNAAVEVHYDWSNADDDFLGIAGVTVEKQNEWGIDVRPGYAVSDMFNPYGILGYERMELKGNAGAFSGTESYNGFVLGAGAEFTPWNNIGIRLDYTHTWYGEKNDVDPDENEVKLGVGYHFL